MRLAALTCLVAFSAWAADELPPDQVAKLKREQKASAQAVEKKYGNKKPSELSAEERKALAKEKAAAEREVLEKAGVDPKAFARQEAGMSRSERAALDAAMKEGDEKDAQAAKDAKKAGKKDSGGIVVEKGGAVDDVNEAAEMDKAMGLGKGK